MCANLLFASVSHETRNRFFTGDVSKMSNALNHQLRAHYPNSAPPDARMFIREAVATSAEMGSAGRSKTLKIGLFGSEQNTFLALRAWALYRASQNGWANSNDVRRRWAARSALQLCKDSQG